MIDYTTLQTPELIQVIMDQDIIISDQDIIISKRDTVISDQDTVISEKDIIISKRDTVISEKDIIISKRDTTIKNLEQFIQDTTELTNSLKSNLFQIAHIGITLAQKKLLRGNITTTILPTVKQCISGYRSGNNLYGEVKKSWFNKKPTQTKIIIDTLDRLHATDEYPEPFVKIDGIHYIKGEHICNHGLVQETIFEEIYDDLLVTAGEKNEYYIYRYTFNKCNVSSEAPSMEKIFANVIHNYVYYGQTDNPNRRAKEHFGNQTINNKKDEVFSTFGTECFDYSEVKIIASKEELNRLERTLFNGTPRTLNNSDKMEEFVKHDDYTSIPRPLVEELENYLYLD